MTTSTTNTGTKKAKTKATPKAAPKAAKKTKAKATPAADKKAPATPKVARTPRESSKKAAVIALLKRAEGATLKEIMAATDWQAHSVRGFISGSLSKKMGLTIESAKREDGERVYHTA